MPLETRKRTTIMAANHELVLDPPPAGAPDTRYQRQLDLFVRCSNGKALALERLLALVARLPRREAFLDIGAGNGVLTLPLAREFHRATAVEPDPFQAADLKRRAPDLRVFQNTWQDVDLGSGLFDFILCSHALYYLPEVEWMRQVDRMYEHLRPGGQAALILQSPLGDKAGFFSAFTGSDVNVLGLWKGMLHTYGEDALDARYYTSDIHTRSLDEMVEIGCFLLLHTRFRDHPDTIRRYLEEHHRCEDGYRLRNDELILLLSKKPRPEQRFTAEDGS
jgi:SAM-dependent methyltransferase